MIKQKDNENYIGTKSNWQHHQASPWLSMLTVTRVNKGIAILVVVFFVGYLFTVNDLAVKGIVLNDLKSKVNELNQENQSIELQTANLDANSAIDSRAQQLPMVKVDKVDYINIADGKVARR
jgi:hypothetical protein